MESSSLSKGKEERGERGEGRVNAIKRCHGYANCYASQVAIFEAGVAGKT